MKEIEECKKLGKRLKHRGLLKGSPDIEEAKKHLAKAEHNLKGITRFKEIGFVGENGEVILAQPEKKVKNGSKLA